MESYELFFLGLQESSDELEHASKAFHLSRFFYE